MIFPSPASPQGGATRFGKIDATAAHTARQRNTGKWRLQGNGNEDHVKEFRVPAGAKFRLDKVTMQRRKPDQRS